MNNDQDDIDFVFDKFASNIDNESLSDINKKLLDSLMDMHISHLELNLTVATNIVDTYRLLVTFVKQSIKEGRATKETKEFLDKLSIFLDKLDNDLDRNREKYNQETTNLIKVLNDLGIK